MRRGLLHIGLLLSSNACAHEQHVPQEVAPEPVVQPEGPSTQSVPEDMCWVPTRFAPRQSGYPIQISGMGEVAKRELADEFQAATGVTWTRLEVSDFGHVQSAFYSTMSASEIEAVLAGPWSDGRARDWMLQLVREHWMTIGLPALPRSTDCENSTGLWFSEKKEDELGAPVVAVRWGANGQVWNLRVDSYRVPPYSTPPTLKPSWFSAHHELELQVQRQSRDGRMAPETLPVDGLDLEVRFGIGIALIAGEEPGQLELRRVAYPIEVVQPNCEELPDLCEDRGSTYRYELRGEPMDHVWDAVTGEPLSDAIECQAVSGYRDYWELRCQQSSATQ